MNAVPPILSIVGLVVEIVGAFFLALEAIGLERVHDWSTRSATLGQSIVRFGLPGGFSQFGLERLAGAGCMLGAMSAVLIGARFGLSLWWTLLLMLPLIFLGLYGTVYGVRGTLRGASTLLLTTAERGRTRTAGVLGFGLLCTGFVLQLIASGITLYLTGFPNNAAMP